MSNATKIAVPLLLLLTTAGAGAWFFLSQQTPMPAPTPPPAVTAPVEPKRNDPPPVTETAPAVDVKPVTQDPIRTEAKPTNTNAHADAPQGVKGRVLLPNGGPAAQVAVFLMENSMNDPIKIFLQNKQGTKVQPMSAGATAEDGTFALGVLQPGKMYDLRVVSDAHPEINHQQIKVREDDWFDTGDLKLEAGLQVAGRVVDEGTKAGIADATVFLVNSNQAHSMVATPGRERGIPAITDRNGNFWFHNGPRTGLVNLSVEAAGYASAQLQNQQLKTDAANEFTIELLRGFPIAGMVVDPNGKPLGGVTVTASGLSAKTPQTAITTSLGSGEFRFESLREGPYQLVTNSTQYNETKTPPVMTGDLEVKLVLTPRAFAKLKVLTPDRQPVKAFAVSLKRSFPNNQLGIGNVPEFADRRINPSDYPAEFGGEWAVVRGLPAGDFVFQVQDTQNRFAKTLSPIFKIVEGDPAPEVEMVLTQGAGIMGRVLDDNGQPVAGATVSTDMDGGFAAEGGFFEIFRSFVPEKHSKASAKTDAKGEFRLTRLAFADYMIRVAHPDYCEGSKLQLRLESEGQLVDAGVIQLSKGAIIEGTTTINGQVAGQVKITVTVPQPEGLPRMEGQQPGQPAAQAPRPMFSATAISDNNGYFRLLKRVPPGDYKINASRASGDNNPFFVLLDMKETERPLKVGFGQDRLTVDFNLSKR